MAKRRLWKASEDYELMRLYPGTPTRELAARMGKSEPQINGRARRLGLHKTPERKREMILAARRTRADG
jgi:hypothetical protein